MDDDFYEDDEPIEKIRADFAAGEKGVTVSRKDLNQRAASIVGEIAERSERDDEFQSPKVVEFPDASTWFAPPDIRELSTVNGVRVRETA